MAAVSQTTLSNAFSWMKMSEFRLRFHWSLFLRVQLTIIQHWFRYWLGAGQATSHYLNQWWLVYWRIYASLGLNGLEAHSPIYQMHILLCIITMRPRKNWMQMYEFRLIFHWSLFLRENWQYSIIGWDNSLASTRRQAIIWTNDDKFTDGYMRLSDPFEFIAI